MSAALLPQPARFAVGVSGHRVPPKLPTQSQAPIRARIDRILAMIVETARAVPRDPAAGRRHAGDPQAGDSDLGSPSRSGNLVIVSAVAEGADRIVAEAGLAAGFGLVAVLPFDRAEYARDFDTAPSRQAFEQLLARAAAVVELDGRADKRPDAYEAAGLVMLDNIDLLIAIWDGKDAAGVGGTAEIVARAIAGNIAVAWIEPTKPTALQIAWSGAASNAEAAPGTFRAADDATVARMVEAILSQPATAMKTPPARNT